ncbi:MAG TPA: hypothetical protein VIY08_10655 [Candidatus Nitrosocosmicus sp.]
MDYINVDFFKSKKNNAQIIALFVLSFTILSSNAIYSNGYLTHNSFSKKFPDKYQVISDNPFYMNNIHTLQTSTLNNPTKVSIPLTDNDSFLSNSLNEFKNVRPENSFCSSVNPSICNEHDHSFLNTIKSKSDTRDLNIKHSDTQYKVIGPDNFKFVNSYWTTDNTQLAIDVGTSGANFLTANPQNSNNHYEADINQGPITLAVVLEYEGVVQLTGITAALKLSNGFFSVLPQIHNTTNYNVAFSNYRGNIFPGQGVVLYFNVYVTQNTQIKPYVGPLALHFLRSDMRTSTGDMDASEQDQFINTLNFQNNNIKSSYTNNFDLNKVINGINERLKPYDFVNQVMPIIYQLTGGETLVADVLSPTNNTVPSSPYLVTAPPGVPTKVRILVSNIGDAPIYNAVVTVSPRDESATSNSLISSSSPSNNVQQNSILPIVMIGPTQKNVRFLPPNGFSEFDVTIVPNSYIGGTVENLFVNISFSDIVGENGFKTLSLGVEILPTSAKSIQNSTTIR